MWAIFRVNVLRAMISGQFKDPDTFADFYANEYDQCIKRGGVLIYGVPVINGNKTAMAEVIKAALKKGTESTGKNFNLLEEICPAAFDAYWLGAEMAPIPNLLLNPAGWPGTPPAPGAISNLGPNPISLAASAAKIKAQIEALKLLEDEIKKQFITIKGISISVYETAVKIINKKPVEATVKNHPLVVAAVKLLKLLKEAKNKKPSIGIQFKPSIKIPFPELPDRQKLIKEATEKLLEEAIKRLKEELEKLALVQIIESFVALIKSALDKSNFQTTLTKEDIKKYVRDTINGIVSSIVLPNITLPKLPSKEELKELIDSMIPSAEELKNLALQEIENLIPDIPYFNFVLPSFKFSFNNTLINPFINNAKQHLTGVGGIMNVMASYPPFGQPAPGIINWSGYRVLG